MTWREKLVARILLLIAQMVADDPGVRQELKNLSVHIGINAPEPEEVP